MWIPAQTPRNLKTDSYELRALNYDTGQGEDSVRVSRVQVCLSTLNPKLRDLLKRGSMGGAGSIVCFKLRHIQAIISLNLPGFRG